MTAPELLGELSMKIYEPPLSEIRRSGSIRDLTSPVAVLMLVIDFETEVAMNGIHNFLGNSTGQFAVETVLALEKIGCSADASMLRRILDLAWQAGMTFDAVQADQSNLEPFAVTSWHELHGDKWNALLDSINDIASKIDYDRIADAAVAFTERNLELIQAALNHA